MSDEIQLLQYTAWPLVTLVAIIILGPGGLLKQIVSMLFDKIAELSKSVENLKNEAATIDEKTKKVVEQIKMEGEKITLLKENMSNDFQSLSISAATLTDKITTITKLIRDMEQNVQEISERTEKTEVYAKIAFESAEQEEDSDEKNYPIIETKNQIESVNYNDDSKSANDAEEKYHEIRRKWSEFTELLKEALGNPDDFDGRLVGLMAKQLADRRRGNINHITKDDAQKIASTYSLFRSFVRRRLASIEDMRNGNCDNFTDLMEKIEKCIEIIKSAKSGA